MNFLPPQISVILPTYNRETWLSETLDSVFAQTFQDFQVIVVDDGSDDCSAQILQKIQGRVGKNRCKIITTPHQGVSHARNTGIRHSNSPLIAFLDTDDRWLPDKLTLQVKELQQNPDAVLCHTEEIWIRNGKRVNACKHHEKNGGMIFEKCLPRCVISPSATLIRRSILDEVGLFDESLPACEDYDLWLRITAHYPVAFLSQPLILKNGGHEDQLSQRFPVMDRFRIQALEKISKDPRLNPPQRKKVLEMIVQKSRIIAQGAEKRKNIKIAQIYAAKAEESQKNLARSIPGNS
jgi:glycosyltransferase involved in cell wall biosynthesis